MVQIDCADPGFAEAIAAVAQFVAGVAADVLGYERDRRSTGM
ncbi:hypothetical protein [Nocardia sp. CA-119907]